MSSSFVKQQETLPVKNFEFSSDEDSTDFKKNGPLLPRSIRAIICGPSGCGKTSLLLSLIQDPNGVAFENIYIYSKSLHQPKYQYLKRIIKNVKGLGYFTFSNNDDVIPPKEARSNSLVIFDDVSAREKKAIIEEYFSHSRHYNDDCFYLTQTYTAAPKHHVRDNANLVAVFKQDDLNLRHIYDDHINSDMSFTQFKELCRECWRDNYGFLTICKEDDIHNGRYRSKFDRFWKGSTSGK